MVSKDKPLHPLAGRVVKVIGLGGIGACVAQGMAQFLASTKAGCPLWLIDGDTYEESNRSRVLFQSYENKAIVKAAELGSLTPGLLTIVPVPRYATPRNIGRLIEERDIILLCVDNHRSRRCVSNRCRRLSDVLLISGGNDGITESSAGTFGNVMAYWKEGGRDVTSPLTRFHPEIARPTDKAPYELSCAELANSGAPQLLFANLQVAATMLGVFYSWLNGKLNCDEVYLDILDTRMLTVRRRGRPPAAIQ